MQFDFCHRGTVHQFNTISQLRPNYLVLFGPASVNCEFELGLTCRLTEDLLMIKIRQNCLFQQTDQNILVFTEKTRVSMRLPVACS